MVKVNVTYDFDLPQDMLQAAIEKKVSEFVDDNYVEVVRCKDCRHTKRDGFGTIYCNVWDRWEMPDNAYCSYGEREGGAG